MPLKSKVSGLNNSSLDVFSHLSTKTTMTSQTSPSDPIPKVDIVQKVWREIKRPFQQGLRAWWYRIFYFGYSLLLPKGLAKDACRLRASYQAIFGRALSLENPQALTEKMQWLKLYDRNPSHTMKADKYGVREFVKQAIGEQHLVKLLGVYNRAEEIDFDALPNQFVLKATHGSQMNIICPDKNLLDRKEAVRRLNQWLKINFFGRKKQWVYKDIPPRIVCEEFLEPNTEWGLLDYKIFCFHGKPEFIQVILDRCSGKTSLNNYDTQWNRLPFGEKGYPPTPKDPPPPPCLDEMLRLASLLAKDLLFVRVDFYYHNGKILFGELTFYPDAGMTKFEPAEMDYELGKLLKLPFEQNDTHPKMSHGKHNPTG